MNNELLKQIIKLETGTIRITKSANYVLRYKHDSESDCVNKIRYVIENSEIEANFDIKIVNNSDNLFELEIILEAPNGVANVKSSLQMRGLLTSKWAKIKFTPSLEIKDKDVSIDHKSTVGAPDNATLNYLASRGFSRGHAIEFLAKSFLES